MARTCAVSGWSLFRGRPVFTLESFRLTAGIFDVLAKGRFHDEDRSDENNVDQFDKVGECAWF
jgi:hypothetical protein